MGGVFGSLLEIWQDFHFLIDVSYIIFCQSMTRLWMDNFQNQIWFFHILLSSDRVNVGTKAPKRSVQAVPTFSDDDWQYCCCNAHCNESCDNASGRFTNLPASFMSF